MHGLREGDVLMYKMDAWIGFQREEGIDGFIDECMDR